MTNAPSPEDAQLAISRIKSKITEFSDIPKILLFIEEAIEVHTKILKANTEKFGESVKQQIPSG